ncbi:MAG: hypothetical protein K0S47_4120, partial [Herbinix sp.]|nr:hypothetical protein [Herbinix sp.]
TIGNDVFVRRIAPNSWWGRFQAYLIEKFPGCTVTNNGCGGIYSYQVRENLDKLYQEDDDIIIILLGTNDRKRQNGMKELHENLSYLVKRLKDSDKQIILITPNPSTATNESYENRLYHIEDVAIVISQVALDEQVLLVNNYKKIQDYLKLTGKRMDDIIYGENCSNDGLHPSDYVQSLMYRNLLQCLELEVEMDDIEGT